MGAAAAALAAPLALLEAIDRDGLVRQAWRIERWPVSIGRALDNTVVLSDPHVAAHHATLDLVDGDDGAPAKIVVSAGETKNGVGVGRERIAGGTQHAIADSGRDLELQIGRAQLRLRLPGHALAAEQAMTPVVVEREALAADASASPSRVLLVVLANTWIDTDPDGLARAAGAIVLTTIAGGAIWCGLWALLSKTFTRQSHFGWHVRVFVDRQPGHARARGAAAARSPSRSRGRGSPTSASSPSTRPSPRRSTSTCSPSSRRASA